MKKVKKNSSATKAQDTLNNTKPVDDIDTASDQTNEIGIEQNLQEVKAPKQEKTNVEDDDGQLMQASGEASAIVQAFLPLIETLSSGLLTKYYSLVAKIKMIASGYNHAMMSMGDVGVGKSTIIRGVLSSLGLIEGKDFIFLRGFSTAAGLAEKLFEHRSGKIIIVDDCDSLLRNSNSLDILKAALDDKYQRKINYVTRRQKSDLPKSFIFSSKMIFITNYQPMVNDIHFAAIQDRCLVQKLHLSPNEKLEYIEKIILPADYRETSFADRVKIFNLLKGQIVESGEPFSFRTYFKLLDFYKYDPEKFHFHLSEMLPIDSDMSLLIKLMTEHPGKSDTWLSDFQTITGKSRRTFYYVLSKVREFSPQAKLTEK